MRTFIQTPRVARWIGCLVLLTGVMTLLPIRAQEAARDQPKNESGTLRAQTQVDQGIVPKAALEQATREAELMEAQLEVQKAAVEEATVRLKLAKEQVERTGAAAAGGAVPESVLLRSRAEVEIHQVQLKVKQAEQRVAEVRLKHAQQRLAQLRGEKSKEKAAPRS